MQRILNVVIESLLIIIAIFTPVAFGTVHLWSISIMEFLILLSAFAWLSKSIVEGKIVFVKTPLNIPIIAFIILIMTQYLIGRITSSKFGTVYPYATKVYFLEALSYILAFLIIVNNIHRRRQINIIVGSIIFIGIILSLYGIIQKLAGATKIFWFQPVRETLLFYSSYFNGNYFAGYAEMIIFLTLGTFFAYIAYLDKKRTFYKFDIFEGWNSLFIFSIAMMIVSLFYTFAQGGIITFIITIAFFYYIFLKRAVTKRWVLITILISIIMLAITALIWIRKEKVLDYLYEISRIFRELNSYGLRMPVWFRTLDLVRSHPIFGTGFGTFIYVFPKYRPNYYFLWLHCHNDYLELLIETGFLGFLIFFFGMLNFFKRYITTLKLRHDPYIKALGYGCLTAAFSIFIYSFIESNMHIGANAMLFSFILAIGYVVIHNRSGGPDAEELHIKTTTFMIKDRFRKTLSFFSLSLIFLYIIGNIVFINLANIYASIGEREKNLDYIRKAIRLEPSSAEYHGLLADAVLEKLKAEGDKKEAIKVVIDELKESIRLNPNMSIYHIKLASAYSYSGNKEKAVEEYKKAQELEPLNAFNYIALAIHYFNEATKIEGVNPYGSKAMEEGLAEYKKALSIDPSLNIDRYKNYLRDYSRIKEALERYSL